MSKEVYFNHVHIPITGGHITASPDCSTETIQALEQLANKVRNWENGNCPESCTGKCDVKTGFLFTECHACGWNDFGNLNQ